MLEQIGIRDHKHRKIILDAAEMLPQITPIGITIFSLRPSVTFYNDREHVLLMLEQIGIRDHKHRKIILDAAEMLPQITPIGITIFSLQPSVTFYNDREHV